MQYFDKIIRFHSRTLEIFYQSLSDGVSFRTREKIEGILLSVASEEQST